MSVIPLPTSIDIKIRSVFKVDSLLWFKHEDIAKYLEISKVKKIDLHANFPRKY